MITQIILLLLQIGSKFIPILYQLKVLKTEAEVREWQRRFQEAARKAEQNALDAVKLKDQHDANMSDLDEKWQRKWGKSAPLPPITPPTSTTTPGTTTPGTPTPDTPSTPVTPTPATPSNVPTITGPAEGAVITPFFVEVTNVPESAELWRDRRWKLQTVGNRRSIPLSLTLGGQCTIDVKVDGNFVCSHSIFLRH